MIPFLILGAGGTARDVLEWLPALAAAGRPHRCIGVLDDDPAKLGNDIGGARVVGALPDAVRWPDALVLDALGGPRSHRRRAEMIGRTGLTRDRFFTLVHPTAVVAGSAVIGVGALVYPFTWIGPGVRLADHVTVLSHGSVNHDAEVGTGTILASHVMLAGGVMVEDHCYLGAGARVRQGVRVGAGAMVGMGSVVVGDVPAGATVAGNPARPLRSAGA
ncbi:MAG TPA: NeuD/PglB/VioB family sugar acetyltransferase [Gemmatimonadales bacterium]|nr:NeuD/PglB/VioB family sugar acetyltransferase [Gemmatimonadales bacterium]